MDCSWDFTGKVALVTGAASGICAEVSLLLAKSGAKVILIDRDEAKLTSVTNNCKAIASQEPLAILTNVSSEQAVKEIETTLTKPKKITVLNMGNSFVVNLKRNLL